MRRFLIALPLLLTVAVSTSDAGYLVVRIILEGGAADGGGAGGGLGNPGGGLGTPGGAGPGGAGPGGLGLPGGGRPGGPGSSGFPPPPMGGPMGGGSGSMGPRPGGSSGGPPNPPGYGNPMGGGTAPNTGSANREAARSVIVVVPYTRPPGPRPFYAKFPQSSPTWDFGLLHPFGSTNILVDQTTIQVYSDFGQNPARDKTRQSEVLEKRRKYTLTRSTNPTTLYDLMIEALEVGLVPEANTYADEVLALADEKKITLPPQVERFVTAYRVLQKPLKSSPAEASDAEMWKFRLDLVASGPQTQARGHYVLIYWDANKKEVERRSEQLENNFKAFFLWHAIRGIVLPMPKKPLVAVLARTGQELFRMSGPLDGLPAVADAFYSAEHDLLVLSPERLDGLGQTFQKQIQQVYREGVNRQALLAGEGPLLDNSHPSNNNGMNPGGGNPGGMGPPPGGAGTGGGGPGGAGPGGSGPGGIGGLGGMGNNNDDPKKDPHKKKPEEVARMQTWAMVERYIEEEAEISGVSREATHQLYYATGLIPRHVAIPQWLDNGAVSFFHRPKGPVITTTVVSKGSTTDIFADDRGGTTIALITSDPSIKVKHTATVALSTGYGVPNYVMQKHWRDMVAAKSLGSDPGTLVFNVVSDAYFTGMKNDSDPDLPRLIGPAPTEDPAVFFRKKREYLYNKAYATSWALYYYLEQTNPAGMQRFFAELNRMPRDLPLDVETRVAAFARAFNLSMNPKGEAGKSTFADLGKAWLDRMKDVAPAYVEFTLTDPAPTAGGTGPGGPGAGPGIPGPGQGSGGGPRPGGK